MQKKQFISDNSGHKVATWILTGNSKLHNIMIVCHGFRGAKENSGKLLLFARRLNRWGIGVVAFDFKGSGESDGDFASVTLSRQVSDLQLVISYVKEQFRLPILLLGRSFGGTTIAAAAPFDNSVAGCIFWSAPINLPGTFEKVLNDGFYRLAMGETISITDQYGEFVLGPDIINDFKRHNLLANLQHLGDIPVLAVQGGQDEVVDPGNAYVLVENVLNGQLILVDQADHRFTKYIRAREDLTIDWIRHKFLD